MLNARINKAAVRANEIWRFNRKLRVGESSGAYLLHHSIASKNALKPANTQYTALRMGMWALPSRGTVKSPGCWSTKMPQLRRELVRSNAFLTEVSGTNAANA